MIYRIKYIANYIDPMDCSLQAPPSMGFSRQEYWSGVPSPSPFPSLLVVFSSALFISCAL